MVRMAAGKVQILKFIGRFAVQVSFESPIFKNDFNIQKGDAGGANTFYVGFEDHTESVVVAEIQELFILFPPMSPYEEYIIDVTVPNQRFFW